MSQKSLEAHTVGVLSNLPISVGHFKPIGRIISHLDIDHWHPLQLVSTNQLNSSKVSPSLMTCPGPGTALSGGVVGLWPSTDWDSGGCAGWNRVLGRRLLTGGGL